MTIAELPTISVTAVVSFGSRYHPFLHLDSNDQSCGPRSASSPSLAVSTSSSPESVASFEGETELRFEYCALVDYYKSSKLHRHRPILSLWSRTQPDVYHFYATSKIIRKAYFKTEIGMRSIPHKIPNQTTVIDTCDLELKAKDTVESPNSSLTETVVRMKQEVGHLLPLFIRADLRAIEEHLFSLGCKSVNWKECEPEPSNNSCKISDRNSFESPAMIV